MKDMYDLGNYRDPPERLLGSDTTASAFAFVQCVMEG